MFSRCKRALRSNTPSLCRHHCNKVHLTESNASINLNQKIYMTNASGSCSLSFRYVPKMIDEHTLICGRDIIFPSTNGFVYTAKNERESPAVLELEADVPKFKIQCNDEYFALMSSKYTPFVTISCIGVVDEIGRVIAPATISYTKSDKSNYKFIFSPFCESGKYIMLDINLYEPKIFQDTTAESKHPSKKNTFGEIAFIGNTDTYGEKWLYIRPEIMKVRDLLGINTLKVILYFPILSETRIPISAYATTKRFCSFALSWSDKIKLDQSIGRLEYSKNYAKLDITELVVDHKEKNISIIGGIVLKADSDKDGVCAIATGDCYCAPPIIEIIYKD